MSKSEWIVSGSRDSDIERAVPDLPEIPRLRLLVMQAP